MIVTLVMGGSYIYIVLRREIEQGESECEQIKSKQGG